MKKYLLFSLLSFTGFLSTYLGLFYYQLGTENTGSYDLEWVAKYQQIKRKNSQAISTPKIMIISGSNSHFGISAKQINQELEIPTINMALHGGITLDYILNEAKQYANAGDIILLALEYEYYSYNGKPNETYLQYVSSYDPEYFKSQSITKQFSDAFYFGWKKILKGILLKIKGDSSNKNKVTEGCYSGITINQWGDETCNEKSAMNKKHFDVINKLGPLPFSFLENSDNLELLKEFNQYCKKNNITLFATFPNTIYFDQYRQAHYQESLKKITRFYKENNITVLGNPYQFMYEKKMFFDTSYHVNNVGRDLRTQKLINLLNQELNNEQ